MEIRKQIEAMETVNLSPYASLVMNSRGREIPEEKCHLRTDFQRDRDRIIYSKAFRRLKHKTQVFISPEGDHYRTRLTHTLEVSQIARTIARCLRLNEDLTEAIALGHDLGHTPFGHAGERVLSEVCPLGFLHNEQSVRVVETLEHDRQGLNLCYEVRNGIKCHTGHELAISLEGRIIKWADRIAYINHDIEDSVRGGIIFENSLPQSCLRVLGLTSKERINNMVTNIIQNSLEQNDIQMSQDFIQATDELRSYLFERVYIGSVAKTEEIKAERMLRQLYLELVRQPVFLPEDLQDLIEVEGIHRVVCDYVAGMTDRFAKRTFGGIYMPESWELPM